jgi:sulfofructose kinase
MKGRALCSLQPHRPLDVVGMGEISLDWSCVLQDPTQGGEGVATALPLAPGEKRPLAACSEYPGGQIATALLGCARLGLRVGFMGSAGDDRAAEAALEPLRAAHVDLSSLRRIAGAGIRRAVVLVDAVSGERSILFHRDPRLALSPGELDPASIRRGRLLHLDATDLDASVWAAGHARREDIPVVLDADTPHEGLDKLLRLVDFPVVDRRLAEELGGTGCIADGLRALASHGARLAVATVGEEGALAWRGEQLLRSPGFRVAVRDATGAGDAFHAGLIWGLIAGLPAEALLRAANAVAALNCQAAGAQGGLPTRGALEEFLKAHPAEGEHSMVSEPGS